MRSKDNNDEDVDYLFDDCHPLHDDLDDSRVNDYRQNKIFQYQENSRKLLFGTSSTPDINANAKKPQNLMILGRKFKIICDDVTASKLDNNFHLMNYFEGKECGDLGEQVDDNVSTPRQELWIDRSDVRSLMEEGSLFHHKGDISNNFDIAEEDERLHDELNFHRFGELPEYERINLKVDDSVDVEKKQGDTSFEGAREDTEVEKKPGAVEKYFELNDNEKRDLGFSRIAMVSRILTLDVMFLRLS